MALDNIIQSHRSHPNATTYTIENLRIRFFILFSFVVKKRLSLLPK